MAQIYAGVLGLLAFLTCLARGLLHGHGPDSVLRFACTSMLAFGVIGLAIGAWAQWIVKDSVESRLAVELADEKSLANKDVAKPVQ